MGKYYIIIIIMKQMEQMKHMKQTQISYKIGDNIQFYDSKSSIRNGIIRCISLPTKYYVLSENLIEFIDSSQIIGKTQVQNHSLPNTLNPLDHFTLANTLNPLDQFTLANTLNPLDQFTLANTSNPLDQFTLANTSNPYISRPVNIEQLFSNISLNIPEPKPVSDTKKWFNSNLILDTNNTGGGHCFYHCIVKELSDTENLGDYFRKVFYTWLQTINKVPELEKVRLETYNDLKKKGEDGLLQISYDGVNYNETTFDNYLLGIGGDAWADNVIISVIQNWITLMEHDKYFIIYDSNREIFTLGGSPEPLPIIVLNEQILDDSFFFINYNGFHYQNLKRIN